MGWSARDVISSLLFGWGVLLFLSPVILYWFIYGSRERYLWITAGPAPISDLGGGPFQLYLYLGLCILGVLFVLTAIAIRRRAR